MYAPAGARQRLGSAVSAAVAEGRGHLDSASAMRDVRKADCDVGYLTQRANVLAAWLVLIFWGEYNAVTGLAETSPAVFHEIPLDLHTDRILQFEVILHDKGIAVRAADEGLVALHPLPRLPEVIVQDLDVGRGQDGRSAAEQNSFTGGLQEIVLDQERTILGVADATGNRMSVGTHSLDDAVEIAEIGIDDRSVGHAIQIHTVVSFILRRSMQPQAIHDDVISSALGRDQPATSRGSCGTCNFQTDEAVIVGTVGELERTVAVAWHLYFRHHVLWVGATILRAPFEGGDPGVAGRGALPFGRQSAVRRTGTDPDPMVDVATLGRHAEFSTEGCTRLQLDHVAAVRVVQSRLQIAARIDSDDRTRRGCAGYGGGNSHSG